jgi:hypothetical protein
LQKRQRTGVAEQLLWVSSCKAVCRRRELCVMIHPMVSLPADSNVHGCNNLLPRDITLLGSPFGWSDNPGKPQNSRVSLPKMIDPNSSLTRKASTGRLGQTVMVSSEMHGTSVACMPAGLLMAIAPEAKALSILSQRNPQGVCGSAASCPPAPQKLPAPQHLGSFLQRLHH